MKQVCSWKYYILNEISSDGNNHILVRIEFSDEFLTLSKFVWVLGEQINHFFWISCGRGGRGRWPLASIFKNYGRGGRGRVAASPQTASGRVAVAVGRGRGGRDGRPWRPQP